MAGRISKLVAQEQVWRQIHTPHQQLDPCPQTKSATLMNNPG